MKILLVHDFYQEFGGEDAVFRAESELLSAAGHQVSLCMRHNDEIRKYRLIEKASLSLRTVWAWDSFKQMRQLLRSERPDVAHFHNTFPLISPSAYYACEDAGVPVVQTLHNYRLLCPDAVLYRDGSVCEDCLHKRVKWPGIVHGCYRGSRLATTAVVAMVAVHRGMGTWMQKVNRYIALSEFARNKFIEGGFPAERIVVKPNFVRVDPGLASGSGKYALFAGRLSAEKGLHTLLAAWSQLRDAVPLQIVGDGPLRGDTAADIELRELRSIDLAGCVPPSNVVAFMHGARFVVFPSESYETFGRVAIEAFACGLPVIASRLGSMAEIVRDGVTGLHFNPGDPADLAAKVDWAWAHPAEMQEMGRAARAEYEAKYTPERNYQILMEIYHKALASKTQQVLAHAARAEATEQ